MGVESTVGEEAVMAAALVSGLSRFPDAPSGHCSVSPLGAPVSSALNDTDALSHNSAARMPAFR